MECRAGYINKWRIGQSNKSYLVDLTPILWRRKQTQGRADQIQKHGSFYCTHAAFLQEPPQSPYQMESTFTNHIILGNFLTFSVSTFSSAKWQEEQYLPRKVVVCIHVSMCRSLGQCLAQQVLKKCQLILSSIPLNLQRISSGSKAEGIWTPGY